MRGLRAQLHCPGRKDPAQSWEAEIQKRVIAKLECRSGNKSSSYRIVVRGLTGAGSGNDSQVLTMRKCLALGKGWIGKSINMIKLLQRLPSSESFFSTQIKVEKVDSLAWRWKLIFKRGRHLTEGPSKGS